MQYVADESGTRLLGSSMSKPASYFYAAEKLFVYSCTLLTGAPARGCEVRPMHPKLVRYTVISQITRCFYLRYAKSTICKKVPSQLVVRDPLLES